MSLSPTAFEAPQPRPSWGDRFSLTQTLISITAAVLAVGIVYGSTVYRLGAVEAKNAEQVDKAVYDADQRAIREKLDRIDSNVQKLVEDRIEELKEQARSPRR
jgi:hypothetical protein